MTTLIDGKKVSSQIRDKISQETAEFIEKTGIQPHLVVIIVGNNPASMTYVRNKKKSCIPKGTKIPEVIYAQIIKAINNNTAGRKYFNKNIFFFISILLF